ncbi:MAG: hypothetical protein U0R66_05445 [Mycobacterium sp.]|mgnify:CR=1 FL=1
MGRHSFPDSGEPAEDGAEPDSGPPSGRIARHSTGRIPKAQSGWQGRRRREDGGRRGVSIGVIAALVTVVVLVGAIILWRFFGNALSRRSSDAADQCLGGTATVAVVADPSIADSVGSFAQAYNADAKPVGDKCVEVVVKPGDSQAVLTGLTTTWPADLGAQPALWLPASSIQSARLQAAVGEQVVDDARSLVTSPVVLAVRPQLKTALAQDGWAALPGLQNDPGSLDARNLPGWGSLRLALPAVGAADASYLAAEAVATTSAPPNSPPTAGLAAVGALLSGQPKLPGNTAQQAWDALMSPGDPAAAPAHAVAITEQQLFSRTTGMQDAAKSVAEWVPGGGSAVADYPTVLLSGPWLNEEQVAAASEFARFMRKPEQLGELAKAGFRVPDTSPPSSDVVSFAPMAPPLPTGDDATRTALAASVAPATEATTTVMLNQNLSGVTAPLKDRIAALPPSAAVGLWTFNGTDSTTAVPTGAVSEDLGGQPRSAALAAALDGLAPDGGGGVSFTTLRLVYGAALAKFRPGQPNSVLVITTGSHTDRTLDGEGLQDYVKGAVDPNRPVAINVIDVGDDPDRPSWEAVVRLSGGTYQAVPPDSPALTAAIARALP